MSTSQTTNPEISHTQTVKNPLTAIILMIATRVGGSKAKEVERFLKFATVGTLGAVIDFGVLNLLRLTILPFVDEDGNNLGIALGDSIFIRHIAIAVTISFVCAILSNFIWNRYWTYPDSRSSSIKKQLTQFATVSVIGWTARTLWITLSYLTLGNLAINAIQIISSDFPSDPDTVASIGSNIALFIGIFIIMIWNFLANRFWTYNDVE